MDVQVQKMIVLGIIGVCIGGLSIWLHLNNKDGSGWGFLAFCFLFSSCSQS